MVDVILIVLGVILLISGFIFCIAPLIPGPLLSYAALFTLYFLQGEKSPSLAMIIITGVLTGVVLTLDLVLPNIGAKKFNCTKYGVWGSVVGSIVGLFFMPWGLVIGPFVGALLGETIAGKDFAASVKGACGAFIGFAAGILLKLEWCLVLTIYYFYKLFF